MGNSFVIAVLINQTKYSTFAYSLEGCIVKQSGICFTNYMQEKLHGFSWRQLH